jgi:hypothetical protein
MARIDLERNVPAHEPVESQGGVRGRAREAILDAADLIAEAGLATRELA